MANLLSKSASRSDLESAKEIVIDGEVRLEDKHAGVEVERRLRTHLRDRRYLADQQESNCPGLAATNRDQVQQTKVSYNRQKPVKNVLKKEVS